MAKRTLMCEIVTPERIVYTSEARMVVAPTIDGEVGVLPLHAPLVSAIRAGEIRVIYEDEHVEWFAVAGGYIQVHEDKVLILADHAAASSQIDVEHARRALDLAQERMRDVSEQDEATRNACEADLKWCETQIQVASRNE